MKVNDARKRIKLAAHTTYAPAAAGAGGSSEEMVAWLTLANRGESANHIVEHESLSRFHLARRMRDARKKCCTTRARW